MKNKATQRKYPWSHFIFFVMQDFFLRNILLFLPGLILCLVGIRFAFCLWIGLVLLGVDLIVSIVAQLRIRKAALTISDHEGFNQMMDIAYGRKKDSGEPQQKDS